MRYGVERTRMSDIAKEAGAVRQTLYSFFDSKDDILCAAIRYFSTRSLSEVKREWEGCDSLAGKIDVYFEHAIIDSFLMISASPDARDMIGGYNAKGRAEIKRVQMTLIETAWELKGNVYAQTALTPHYRRGHFRGCRAFAILGHDGQQNYG